MHTYCFMEPYWNVIEQIVKESDIILEILDARLADISRNKKLEEIIKKYHRPNIIVLNKADLVSKEDLDIALHRFSEENENVICVSNKQKKTVRKLILKIKQVFNKYGKRKEYKGAHIIKKPYREARGDVIIGVVGYPNVGKSSIINALAFKKKAKVSSKAGTTHGVHWISATKEIKLIDTPGVIPLEYVDEAKLGLISARGPEKTRDTETVALKIIELFMAKNETNRLEEFYNIKFENSEISSSEILNAIALQKKHLKKGGLPDETRTAIMIMRDWQNGKLKL